MKNLNQKSINKVLITAILFLTLIVLVLRFSEQKRVEYYICYEKHASMLSNPDYDVIKEYCQERND